MDFKMKDIDKVPVDFANKAADKFINYFKNYSCLEDYLRFVKKQVIEDFESDSGESRADLSQFLNEGSIGDDFLIMTYIQKRWTLMLHLLVIDFIMV